MSDKKKHDQNASEDGESDQERRQNIIGLGKFSARKSYYPELQKKIQELKEEKNKYERIFSGALNGIFQAEPGGGLIVANEAMVKLCGYQSQGQLLSITTIRDQLFADPEENDRLVTRLSDEKSVIGFETQFKRQDGTHIDISLNAAVRTSVDSKYLECFVQDISERKKAEEELRAARNYTTNIIDSMPSILIGIDISGNVTHWNKTASEAIGIPAESARGKYLADVLPQMSSEMDIITESMNSRTQKYYPKRQHTSGTDICYEDITVFPLVSNDINGAVIRIDDVTNKVRMEEMMIQSEKMLSVGGLAAGMAHEINNPVAGMMQTANVMANRLTDIEMPANKRVAKELGISLDSIKSFMEKRSILRMLDAIKDSGAQVAKIVENMLSFARKSDTSVFLHNPVSLMEEILTLAETAYDLKKEYDFKTIKIIKEYEENLPMLPCQGAKIQQVLLNILRNGTQAMQESTNKNIKPTFIIRLKKESDTTMLRLEIEDNGPGMDDTIRKRVFEPFFTTKPVGVGTGLGLSVSYFIITENHGGEMRVESAPGSGTKFIIRLPLEGKKEAK